MTLYEQLETHIKYAKTSTIPRDNFHVSKGMIDMAYEFRAITLDEYLRLDHKCVAEGINNPKYF